MKKVVFLANLVAMSAVLGMQNNVAEENRDLSKNPMRPVNANDSRMVSYESFTDREWILKILKIRSDEDFNAPQNSDGQTILMCATKYANCKIMQQVLNVKDDKGNMRADINAQDKNGDTSLSIAAKAGDDEKILLLLKNSADVELAKKKVSGKALEKLESLYDTINQHTGVLLRNLLMGNIDIAKSVLRSPYININTRGRDDGASILQMCANAGLARQVSLLLTHPDIDINAQDKDGNTALIAAICNNHLDTVYSLLKHPKINVNLHNKTEDAPLMCAVYVGNVSIVKLLLNCKGIDVNKQTKYGITALMSAVYNNHQEIVKLLLDHRNIKINVQDNLGLSVLMYADLAGNSEIFKLLINCKDIDVNLQDRNGKTALVRSAEGGKSRDS